MTEEEYRPEEKASLRKKYKVRITLASMIRQRGYIDVSKNLNENTSWEEFETKYRADTLPDKYICFKVLYVFNFKGGDENKKLLIQFYKKNSPFTYEEAKISI